MKNEKLIKQFGLEIKRRRLSLGLTQEEFADHSGFHRTYISGIERGERNPTLDVIITFAKYLDTTPSELLREVSK